jgi:hypothetical protein
MCANQACARTFFRLPAWHILWHIAPRGEWVAEVMAVEGQIKRGSVIVVRDTGGRALRKRALSEVVDGATFPVVWACREEEWQAAEAEERAPDGDPWPAMDVTVPTP